MYPNLRAPLAITLALLVAWLAYVLLFRPVSRRLASRQLVRRPSDAVLAISGAALGTAIIVGALVVGDTLNFSVRQTAYRTLGPIDERIISSATVADQVTTRLDALRTDPQVDGILTVRVDEAAATADIAGQRVADPRVLAWDVDYPAAASFGSAGGPSGLPASGPSPGHVIVNAPLARSLRLNTGDPVTVYLYGAPHRYVVSRIVPDSGLAGAGFGAAMNRNAFLPTRDLERAAAASGLLPKAVTFISNRGGVEAGASLTTPVTAKVRAALQGVPVIVETPKRAVLDAARKTGDALGALFLMIGSFSIIAGALLLVNIFTMLAEERKSQLGMLRAVGMKRLRLVESFTLEGAAYAVGAIVPGVGLGLLVGWGVAVVSAQIFRSWSADGSGLSIEYAVTPTSVFNAVAMGLIIALTTIIVTSVRISRFNVIAAIRDLPQSPTVRARRLVLTASSALAVFFALAALPAIANSQPEATLVLPSLAAVLALPALKRALPERWSMTSVAAFVLAWSMIAPVVRPHMFDSPSMAVYVIQGSLVAFSGVVLISQNQSALLRPLRVIMRGSSETGFAMRLAIAYPLAKRFRTGATLVMYTLITLVLVLLVEITGTIDKSINMNVAQSSAGYALRVDVNPAFATRTLAALRTGSSAGEISNVTPLTTATTWATDPGRRTTAPIRAIAVGVPGNSVAMRLNSRLPRLASDRAAWQLVETDPRYVVLDPFFNATGGPNGKFYKPGDSFIVTDPQSGRTATRIIAGIVPSGLIFYPAAGDGTNTYPIISSARAVHQLYGANAVVSAALVGVRAGVDPQRLASSLQAEFLSSSLVATPIAVTVRRLFDANTAFFRLMQGFLALGLLVGITGLGVVMVRAVRERRRTIGVMRALGVQARTVRRSFLAESAFIAAEGVLLGSVLGVLTTWLMYQKSAAFDGVRAGFPVEWLQIAGLASLTFVASLVATFAPARRAANVLPAVAVRIAD